MRSIQGRLRVWLLLGAGLPVLAAGLVLRLMIGDWLTHELDETLVAKAQLLSTFTHAEAGALAMRPASELLPDYRSRVDPEYFELWDGAGRVVARSASLAGADLAAFAVPAADLQLDDLELPDGRRGRLARVAFVPSAAGAEGSERAEPAEPADRIEPNDRTEPADPEPAGRTLPPLARGTGAGRAAAVAPRAVIAVAIGTESVTLVLASLDVGLALLGVLVLGSLVLFIDLALRRGLAPLRQVTREVAQLDATSLGSRVALDDPPRELVPIVEQLNALLARLARAFERERQLSDDVAHELRTPVAELRSLAEVAMRWPEDGASAARPILADVHGIALQMEALIERLLALARSEAEVEAPRLEAVRIAPAVSVAWRRVEEGAVRREMALEREIDPEAELVADPDRLGSILENLLANAVEHGAPGGWIRVSAIRLGGTTTLRVSNRAPGLCHEDLDHLFDRFWRKDPARSGSRHSGLGLALVRSFGVLHLVLRGRSALSRGDTLSGS